MRPPANLDFFRSSSVDSLGFILCCGLVSSLGVRFGPVLFEDGPFYLQKPRTTSDNQLVQSLFQSPRYRKFVGARDVALEHIFQNAQIKIDNILRSCFTSWISNCSVNLARASRAKGSEDDLVILQDLDRNMSMVAAQAAHLIDEVVLQLRRNAYVLSVSSEAEAIGQATGQKTNYQIDPHKLSQVEDRDTWSGSTIHRRITLGLSNIQGRLKKTMHWLLLNPEIEHGEAIKMLIKQLPKTKPMAKKKRVLKPPGQFKEAGPTKQSVEYSGGYISDEDWEDVLDEYLNDNIKVNRGPEEVLSAGQNAEGENVPHYAWEIEQEVTQDFVYQVRQGQIDAAKQNGIVEFVWIAVVDDKTDECCLWRDGLTTKEIEDKLRASKKGDECDSIVPPAHFNCRCTLAPATKDLPEVPESNQKEFDEWINS